MEGLQNVLSLLHKHKPRLVKEYGLNTLAVFGSYSRSTQTTESDIDILVDFDKAIGIEFIDLAIDLEKILHSKVDLVSLKGIKSDYFKMIEPQLRYV